MTESQLRPPKARLVRLGPILIPLVTPPKPADTALAMPRRISRPSSPARSSPGWLVSLAQRSASIEAMTARASALDRITETEPSSGAAIGSPEKSTNTVRIAALGRRTNNRAQHIAEARNNDSIVSNNAAAKADQDWGRLRRDSARVPRGCKGQCGDQHAQRPRLAYCTEHACERNIMLVAQDVAKLYQEQQHGGHVLET